MASASELTAPPRAKELRVAVTTALVVALFIAGLATTALFALVSNEAYQLAENWLAALLAVSKWMPYLLLAGLVPAILRVWRERSRLARRLMGIMLAQFLLASVLVLLPFWAFTVSYDNLFGESLDESVSTSDNLSDEFISQGKRSLELVAVDLADAVAAAGGASLGIMLDEVRLSNGLDEVALVGPNGRIRITSPADVSMADTSPFIVQKLSDGETISRIEPSGQGGLRLVHYGPLPGYGQGRAYLAVQLVRSLPADASADIIAAERANRQYLQTRALRDGLREAMTLVLVNSIALLLFVAVYMSVYTGTKLGRRLGSLSEHMRTVAYMSVPRGDVPVVGDDEITAVSKDFNEMANRVGATVRREQQTREELEQVQRSMDNGLVVLDSEGRIRGCNEAAADLLGFDEEAVEGLTLVEVAGARSELAAVVRDEGQSREVKVGRRKLWVRVIAIGDGSGRRIVMLTDISEPLALEEMRSRQEALENTLHSIKNPLQTLMTTAENIDRFEKLMPEGERGRFGEKRDVMLRNVRRIDSHIRNMRAFVTKGAPQLEAVDVNDAVRAAVQGYADDIASGPQDLELELQEGLPRVMFTRFDLNDLIDNILTNAREQFELVGVSKRRSRIRTVGMGNKVQIEFCDNAGGVAPERMADIFKPHKSYKQEGQGIGLARVKTVVEAAGGTIDVANMRWDDGSEGACFSVSLKAAGENA